jgi:hypothetical protein
MDMPIQGSAVIRDAATPASYPVQVPSVQPSFCDGYICYCKQGNNVTGMACCGNPNSTCGMTKSNGTYGCSCTS